MSLQRPRHCYGAHMEFYRVPTEFLLAILSSLRKLSLGFHSAFHSAHNACTALSRHSHCAEDAVTSQRTPYNLCANVTDGHGVCTTTLVRPWELLLRCRRHYFVAMVTLRRPKCALIRTPSDGVCFEHAQQKFVWGIRNT